MLFEYLASAQVSSVSEPLYSNVGYAVLEQVLLMLDAGNSDSAIEAILPTGITDWRCSNDTNSLAPGYTLMQTEAKPWHFPTFMGSEGQRMCMEDFFTLAEYLVDRAPPLLWEKNQTPINKYLTMSRGFFVVTDKKAPDVYVHTGRTSGHSAYLAVVPKTGTAVCVLSNSSAGTMDLGFHVLRMMNRNWKRKE